VSSRLKKWVLGGLGVALLGAALTAGPVFISQMGEPVSAVVVDHDAQTRYPIVLAHGLMGFGYMGKQSYWRDIPETLRSHGAQVYVTQVSSFNNSELRGEQLLAQVRQIMEETGAKKVNLIGHSHGSQSVRYVAGMRPEWVASVTTVAGPTTGSEVADWLAELQRTHPLAADAILGFGNTVGALINSFTDARLPISADEALKSLSSAGAASFNRRFPAGVPADPCSEGAHVVDGIHYYSWSSIGQFYRALNQADYLMALSSKAFTREAENDGLVGRCSSHFGQVIRDDYPMNHFQSVNQMSGLVGPNVDPVALYVDHARRLKAAGL
jgi:triacylglycerol lipase